jgi:hypothetical protein
VKFRFSVRRAQPTNRTKLFNAAAAAPPERVVHPDTPTSRVPDDADPVDPDDDPVE